jgi:hypothetical protein
LWSEDSLNGRGKAFTKAPTGTIPAVFFYGSSTEAFVRLVGLAARWANAPYPPEIRELRVIRGKNSFRSCILPFLIFLLLYPSASAWRSWHSSAAKDFQLGGANAHFFSASSAGLGAFALNSFASSG